MFSKLDKSKPAQNFSMFPTEFKRNSIRTMNFKTYFTKEK